MAAALAVAAPCPLPASAAEAAQAERAPAPTSGPASEPVSTPRPYTPNEARGLYNKGRYRRAAGAYRGILARDGPRVATVMGLADTLAIQGQYSEALTALDRAGEGGQADALWHAARARLLAEIGKYDQALAAGRRALDIRPDCAQAILAVGRLLELTGRKGQAIATYKTVESTLTGRAYRNAPAALVAVGQILDRLSILTGRRASTQADNILHNYLQRSYLDVDDSYWPGRVAAGMFLLGKHRPKSAKAEFAAAAKQNPRSPLAAIGLAAIHMGHWELEQADKALRKGLVVNPRHPELHVARGVLFMQWRKFDQVEPALRKALAVNPNHLEALSLLAALHVRLGHGDRAAPAIERIEQIHNGPYFGMHLAVGDWLGAARQFDRAAEHLRKAAALAPELAQPWAELGLLHMRQGDEDLALTVLEKAHALDDYRADVVNYINLLKRMRRRFVVRETEHFIIKVDKIDDIVLGDLVGRYMERIHPQLCSDFNYQPTEKTLIEIFPTHEGFSLRITGKGWIGTVGASTGRVIALAAPHPKRSPEFGRFNWATVLRHEYTHTLTLGATGQRIPHWLTEALAVFQQPDRRNFQAVQALVKATRAGRLFAVRELDWGFIRPKRLGDRGLAYAQADWMAEYIIATHGYETILKMLEGFRDGMTQAEVFDKLLGTTEQGFDKAFTTWAAGQVKQWGFDLTPPPNLPKALAAAKADPDDAAAQAALARAHYATQQYDKAVEAARNALALDETNARALAALALVAERTGRDERAVQWAEKLQKVKPDSRVALCVLGRLHLKHRRIGQAVVALERLKLALRLDAWSYEQLAKIYLQLGQDQRALPNLIELNRHNLRDPRWPRQIAEIYRDLGRPEEALGFYEQVIQINPYDTTVHQTIASLQLRAGRYDEAIHYATAATQVAGDVADTWAVLARVCYFAGRARKQPTLLARAKQAGQKAVRLDPASPAAKIVEAIDRLPTTGPSQ